MKRIEAQFPPIATDFWGRGCPKCQYGIASAPDLTGAGELYLERLVQAIDGDLQFCECKAGIRYRNFLRNRRLALLSEAKNDGRMSSFAAQNTHPDIEATRRAMGTKVEFVRAPTMRWVDTHDYPVPPEEQPESELA